MTRPWPGRPAPLGATWDGEGTDVALYSSSARSVDVCLFDDASGGSTEARVPLEESAGHVWRGHLPGVGPGQRYGFRVDGSFDPARGLRHDPAKLLLDPYARAVDGELHLDDTILGPVRERQRQGGDSAPHVPRSVVVHDTFAWGGDVRPGTAWADSVVYELHVKGFTALHPDVPERLRGTYAGLAHPAAVAHLLRLGVTAVELLPVHHFVSEPHLLRRGLTNHWGYNTVGYFAPHAAYSASGSRGEQVRECKAMVRALHAAGIEVLLDVVYNHTGEGDPAGPTLAWRGIDNTAYYRTEPDDPSRYRDYTGCGNTLDVRSPQVLQTVMDSLRYWVSEMHIDGFRFDLAATLGRGAHEVDMRSALLAAVAQDPVVSQVKLVAEPWDVGDGGYQVGRFPHPWSEWNGEYRDAVRDVWRGHGHGVRALGYRLSGSSDLYQHGGRRPYASVNFVTSHDGFPLRDLVSYDRKHNEANGEGDRDGEDHNRSWNCGVEGETSDPSVLALRGRQVRNLLATLLLSTGVPMLSMGDEVGRTQGGNNNAYCQDGPLSWMPWDGDEELLAFTARLVALRRQHPVLRQPTFFSGRAVGAVKDVGWFDPDGREMTQQRWDDPSLRTLGMYVCGAELADDSFLLLLHAGADDLAVELPGEPWAGSYEVVLDTADRLDVGAAVRGRLTAGQRSVVLLRVVPPG